MSIQSEAIRLRKEFNNLLKAKCHAEELLPKEPCSLVKKYLEGKRPQTKQEIVANRHSRFTKPANKVTEIKCDCSGKCATRRCPCKMAEKNALKHVNATIPFASTNKSPVNNFQKLRKISV